MGKHLHDCRNIMPSFSIRFTLSDLKPNCGYILFNICPFAIFLKKWGIGLVNQIQKRKSRAKHASHKAIHRKNTRIFRPIDR